MCRFIETIRLEHGEMQLVQFHQNRMNRTVFEAFGILNELNLAHDIHIPDHARNGIVKCRIVYDTQIRQVTFTPYERKEIRSLQVVYNNEIDYHLKRENRSDLNRLVELRNECDDVLIVKNGFITDTWFCNVVFETDSELITSNTPLLNGVMREYLIDTGQIKPVTIRIDDLNRFKKVHLINAMNRLYEMPPILINDIIV